MGTAYNYADIFLLASGHAVGFQIDVRSSIDLWSWSNDFTDSENHQTTIRLLTLRNEKQFILVLAIIL